MSIHLPFNRIDVVSLLRSCYRREAAAQENLYRNYYPFARNIALGYADDEPGAEDIVQDAFIKLFGHLKADSFSGDFEKFFRRIIVNTGIDHYRARSTRRRLTSLFGYSMRHRRFRPYLGISLRTFLYGDFNVQEYLFDRESGRSEVTNLIYAVSRIDLNSLEILPRGGFQYDLSGRFSIGVEIVPGVGIGGRWKL